MPYAIKTRPDGKEICRESTERNARILISVLEGLDALNDKFEPETYYIEEVREWRILTCGKNIITMLREHMTKAIEKVLKMVGKRLST